MDRRRPHVDAVFLGAVPDVDCVLLFDHALQLLLFGDVRALLMRESLWKNLLKQVLRRQPELIVRQFVPLMENLSSL